MKKHTYRTRGVCSRQIDITLTSDNRIEEVVFTGGCPGNTLGVAILAKGRDAGEVIELLEGTECGIRGTSCPDQLAQALREALTKRISA